jgi:SprT-like family
MTKPNLLKLFFTIFASALLLFTATFLIKKYALPASENNNVEIVSSNKIEQVSNEKTDSFLGDKVEKDKQLQTKADSLLSFFDNMPPVPVFTKDEPILKTGTNTERGIAYTICESRINPTIFVKKIFYQKANQKQLINMLKHELTHAWFCRQGIQIGHGEQFRKKFKEIGGFGN